MKAVVAAFNQEKALVGAFSVITNLRMQLFEALVQEWLADLETRHGEMVGCWAGGDRVEALKIIIQCLKSLSDSCAVQFYPAKVFHVLDVLSSFVSLVEKRLEEMDPVSAVEVAKNWFYKIYSIRCVRFYFITM